MAKLWNEILKCEVRVIVTYNTSSKCGLEEGVVSIGLLWLPVNTAHLFFFRFFFKAVSSV